MGIARLLTQPVTIERYAGSGPAGAVYDTPVDTLGRLEADGELVLDSTGTQVLSQSRLYLLAGEAITPESRVTADGQTTTVIGVEVVRSPAGPHHLEARLR
jgi:hypothetical protein